MVLLLRCLLHDWSDIFADKEDEKAYQTAQQQALAPLFKTLCIITIIHYGFMVLAMNSNSVKPPALVIYGMYAFVLPVTLALPLVAFGRLERGRQVVVVLNAYAFAYLVMSVSVACKISPGSFSNNYCAGFSTLSAAQSLYATLGPLFMLIVGRLHRGINFAVSILLVALLGWTLSRNTTSTWQTTAYMTGFYVWLTLLSYWFETVDREKHLLRRALILQVDATLRAQSGEVREAASKRHFVSYIFHELRVPMNTFGIGLGNLEEEGLFAHYDPAQQAVLDAIKSSFGMMESVLNDVLDFEKMQEGRFTLHSEPFDVNATAQATVSAFASVARDKGITLESSFEEELSTCGGGWVLGDDIRYRQILNNYLSNALKFTNRGGTVTMTTSLHKKEPENADQVASDQTVVSSPPTTVIVRTSVTDTGCGISPQNLENLFKPYIQIESRLTQNGKGTGLGLAICKHIVELAGGTCGVDSTLGQGSRFWFELELPVANKRARDSAMIGIVAQGSTTSCSLPNKLPSVNTSSASVNDATSKGVTAGQQRQRSLLSSSAPQLLKRNSGRDMHMQVAPSISAPVINSSRPATSAQSVIQRQQPLPLITSASSSVTTKSPRRGRSLHILSADDDPITRMLMSRLLSQMGHTVVLAHDGRHALSLLAQHNRPGIPTRDEFGADIYLKPSLPPSPPNPEENEPAAAFPDDDTAAAAAEQQLKPFEVILLDNQMPICTGEQAVRIITKTWKMDIVVIGITGNALREDQDRFLEAGARMVITKPLRREILRTALEELSMVL
ncbi:HisKA [Geranomyces variabilis]|uniref:histidine kinase n=1 Tax=Geranomyces variabilis TaxID=109894 RepID=A0AAD5TCX9_9FUNG|nr:HisKA [Geranomyces variabilis]